MALSPKPVTAQDALDDLQAAAATATRSQLCELASRLRVRFKIVFKL